MATGAYIEFAVRPLQTVVSGLIELLFSLG